MGFKNKGSVTVLIPCVVAHNLDAHTGIPFLPHMAAYMAGSLYESGYDVQVIDCFGLQPNNRRIFGEFMLMGIDESSVISYLPEECQIVFLYCRTLEDYISIERLCSRIRKERPEIRICLFENIQTVNSFSIRLIVEDLFKNGCDIAMLGEPERRADQVAQALLKGLPLAEIKGISYQEGSKIKITEDEPFNDTLDELPIPLWEKFPMEGYWIAGFSHAPIGRYKFLPILTSRGCPYKCTFCISPDLNPKWRARSAVNVVDEMEYFYKSMNVSDFHVSDLNPTVSDKRVKEICKEILSRNLPVTWKLAQGTKIETIKSEETLELMYKAGCRFFSFSPETGSPKLLKIMNKPFNHDHGLAMVRKMNSLGMRTQACFIAGIPQEDEEDKRQSIDYVKKLVEAGVDEIAVFVFTPLPGAKLSPLVQGYEHYSQCTRSPSWRKDYKEIKMFRRKMYLTFFLRKMFKFKKVFREIFSFFSGQFETKMEMAIYKLLKFHFLYHLPGLFKKLNPAQTLEGLKKRQVAINIKAKDYEKQS